ncbi:acetyl-CoA carboxylase carboxyl transferase subunit beta [Deinobacterium chartae]|uniref:Acetyl-coenzyme A carboxylase carboxyl transferase subunit beta n=1 Tax=Deinobacterium chartae TaxID=521158 RepID=A0A841I634_9DEIO|nr:acetyl-CoA carboxylase carboxyl transferase subunit beta [Deinobacterium chartae]
MALEKFFRRKRPQVARGDDLPDLWSKCAACGTQIYNRDFDSNLRVCPKCGHHHRISVAQRIEFLLDQGSFEQTSGQVYPLDPLNFEDTESYPERLRRAQNKTGRPDAVVAGRGTLLGRPLVLAVMDFEFSGGSMGSVVGEEIARAAELAVQEGLPLLLVAASGGARMQESALSLMQMAKTTVALQGLSNAGLPYISLLTDPTTGGVTASFATIADVIVAEPGALIGFAGPRVIQQTIRQSLPEGFQRAEFLLEHGMVDLVVDRRQQRATLATVLSHLTRRSA